MILRTANAHEKPEFNTRCCNHNVVRISFCEQCTFMDEKTSKEMDYKLLMVIGG